MSCIYLNANGGGIANRLNLILNGLSLHKLTNKKVVCSWHDRHYTCRCKFSDIYKVEQNDIFELREEFNVVTKNYVLMIDFPEEGFPHGSVEPKQKIFFKDLPPVLDIPEDCDIIVRTPNLHDLGTPIPEIMRLFHSLVTFQPAFKEFISTFISKNPLDIGVHLRMTDKIFVNKYNIENFIHDLANVQDQYPGRSFFICSDDKEYEEKALSLLPNSFHYEKLTKIEKKMEDMPLVFKKEGEQYDTFENFVRNKEYSIDGFRDLYLLGCCNDIIGINHWGSTYYNFARYLIQANIRFLFEVE